jgi:hypothetical protein
VDQPWEPCLAQGLSLQVGLPGSRVVEMPMARSPSPCPARAGTVVNHRPPAEGGPQPPQELAVDLERTMNDLIAKALDDPFRKHEQVDR